MSTFSSSNFQKKYIYLYFYLFNLFNQYLRNTTKYCIFKCVILSNMIKNKNRNLELNFLGERLFLIPMVMFLLVIKIPRNHKIIDRNNIIK